LPLIRAELQRRRLPRPGPLLHDLSQVLYLPFDHDDGSYARDRSGYDNHGTIYGATLATGKIGMARNFDGVDDYVEVPHNVSLDITDAITIGLWIKTPTPEKDFGGLLIKGTSGSFVYDFSLWGTTRRLRFGFFVGEYVTVYGATLLSANRWYHVVATYSQEEGVARIYLDGVVDGTLSENRPISTNTLSLYTGYRGDAHPFDGIIDEVHVYNRALSEDEIARLMYLRGI